MTENSETIDDDDILVTLPGQRLCLLDDSTSSGPGTYERHGYIYSSLAGIVNVKEENDAKQTKTISVTNPRSQVVVPVTGDVVTAQVLVVNPRFAKCSIICVNDIKLDSFFRGVLRKEDVRATEKDRVDIYKCFRPGDIILARVLPQSELASYQLSTAENELGVVVAYAHEARKLRIPMVPVGWTEMQCPRTLIKEPRKVAKVVPESALKPKPVSVEE